MQNFAEVVECSVSTDYFYWFQDYLRDVSNKNCASLKVSVVYDPFQYPLIIAQQCFIGSGQFLDIIFIGVKSRKLRL
jgi:hypothetical protein